jgi:PAS domain S-box-containing protein
MAAKADGARKRPGPVRSRQTPDAEYRLLFEANPHPMWVYDLETLAFLAVNDAAIRHYGYSRNDFLGMTIRDIRPPEDAPALLASIAQLSEPLDGAGIRRHRKKDGTLIEVEITSHALTFADRRAALVLADDITLRRRTEQALRESEERYRLLFDLESDAIFLIDNRSGRLLEANSGAVAMYGYSRDELLAMRNMDLSAEPEDTERVTTRTPIDPGATVRIPLRYHRRKDGAVFPVEITGRFFEWRGRGVHIAAIRDIAERKRSEEALVSYQSRLEALLRGSLELSRIQPLELLLVNIGEACGRLLQADGGDFRLVEGDELVVTARWGDREKHETPARLRLGEGLSGQMAALGEPQIVDDPWENERIRPLTRDSFRRLGYRTWLGVPAKVGDRLVATLNVWCRQPNGFSDQDVAIAKAFSAQAATAIDNARLYQEARQAEAALRQANLVVESSPAVLFRWRAVDGWPVELVSENVRQFGYTPQELLSGDTPYVSLIHPEDLPRVSREVAEYSVAGTESFQQVYRLVAKDGRTRWVDDRTSLERDATGQITHYQGILLDITDQKRIEENQRRLEEQMRHVQKLESLGVLAGGIAHDFNNLLMAILGNTDLAMLQTPPESPARGNLEEIVRAAHQAADLCRQMLAYSGKGRFVIERLDLSAVVQEMAHMLQVSISKKAILRYDFPARLPAVEADATQLRQVVMNLITNASEALGDRSGVISVTTGTQVCDRTSLAGSVLGAEGAEGLYAFLEVSDTGCGMAPETVSRIFDPFFSTKFTGRGLGLAAVLGIVHGHQGVLKVQSAPGRGSTFRILFPVVAGEVRPPEPSESADGWHGSGTVLLVDDEAMIRSTTVKMLAHLGFQTLTARDGQEALDIFRANPDAVTCVLLDLTMPRMNGEEAFHELRRIRPDLRVILSSGYNQQDVTQRFAGRGPAGFIQKPYTVAQLQQVLQEVLG